MVKPINKEFYKNVLRPLSSNHIKKYDFVGFDVETYGKNNDFYMGGIYYYAGELEKKPVYKSFYNKEAFCEFLMTRKFYGKYMVATNLDFDLTKLFYKSKYWNDLHRVERSGQLLYAEWKHKHSKKNGSIKFIDTTNYIFWGVEKLGSIIGVEKQTKPSCWKKTINKRTGNEEYEPRKPKNQTEKEELEEYNKYDCKISCDFMYFLQRGFNEAGGKLKITIASTSFDIWRRKFLKTLLIKEKYTLKSKMGDDPNDFIFEAYYGGRTESYAKGEYKDVYYYDVNSLYPSVMRDYKYPLPNSVQKPYSYNETNIRYYEGVSHVTIKSPGLKIPFLPVRSRGKLLFPNGEFKGHYNHNELRYALKLGYTIRKIHDQIIYTEEFDPFSEFVNYFYEKRQEYKKLKNPMELVQKIILNSLYGKFGMRNIQITKITRMEGLETVKAIQKAMGPNPVIKDGHIIRTENRKYTGKNSYPIIASYVTSYSRIRMYEYLCKPGVLYTDTDSIITTNDLKLDSKLLGEMKLEGKYDLAYIIKPKMYYLHSDDQDVVKLKGIRKPDLHDFKDIIRGVKVEKKKLSRFKESLRRDLVPFSEMMVSKSVKLIDDKRLWDGNNSSPLTVNWHEDLSVNLTQLDYNLKIGVLESQFEKQEYVKRYDEARKFIVGVSPYIYAKRKSEFLDAVVHCYKKGINPELIDWFSCSNDIGFIEFVENEYGIGVIS